METLLMLTNLINETLEALNSPGDRRQAPDLYLLLTELQGAFATNLAVYINLIPEELL